jgi:hypothetical protein
MDATVLLAACDSEFGPAPTFTESPTMNSGARLPRTWRKAMATKASSTARRDGLRALARLVAQGIAIAGDAHAPEVGEASTTVRMTGPATEAGRTTRNPDYDARGSDHLDSRAERGPSNHPGRGPLASSEHTESSS